MDEVNYCKDYMQMTLEREDELGEDRELWYCR